MPRKEDVASYVGQHFGHWVVLAPASPDKHRQARVMCRCECGATLPVSLQSLKQRRSSECKRCAAQHRTKAQPSGRCLYLRTDPRTLTPQERLEMAEELAAAQQRVAELEAELKAHAGCPCWVDVHA